MLSFKKWLEATGAARAHTAAGLIGPPQRIIRTGTKRGGVPHYDGVKIIKNPEDPEKMFGVKNIERQSKK